MPRRAEMAILKRPLLYAVADTLGIPLRYDSVLGKVAGNGTKVLMLGGLKVPFNVTVISSYALGGGTLLLIARVKGNLALLVHAQLGNGNGLQDLYFLNLAKMGKAEGWLEKQEPESAESVVETLGAAIVRGFRKHGGSWTPL
jgi:hypothetical protein